jgi:tetratricopeptide (TPR) repeat protein
MTSVKMEEIKDLYRRALKLAEVGSYNSAIEYAQTIVLNYPNVFLGYFCLAAIYGYIENWKQVYINATKANELDPDNPAILNHLGVSLCQLGKIREGLFYLQRGTELGDRDCYNNLGYWIRQLSQ